MARICFAIFAVREATGKAAWWCARRDCRGRFREGTEEEMLGRGGKVYFGVDRVRG